VPGCNDTLEFRSDGEHWTDERGRRVSIEAMLAQPVVESAARNMGALG
jgi:hypothetical protein